MTRARLLTVGLFVTVFAIGIGFAHVYLTRAGGALDPDGQRVFTALNTQVDAGDGPATRRWTDRTGARLDFRSRLSL